MRENLFVLSCSHSDYMLLRKCADLVSFSDDLYDICLRYYVDLSLGPALLRRGFDYFVINHLHLAQSSLDLFICIYFYQHIVRINLFIYLFRIGYCNLHYTL